MWDSFSGGWQEWGLPFCPPSVHRCHNPHTPPPPQEETLESRIVTKSYMEAKMVRRCAACAVCSALCCAVPGAMCGAGGL